MKRILLSAAAAALIAGPAIAADIPVKTPLYRAPPPVVYGWAGCYIGANGGYAWLKGKSAYQDPNTINANPDPLNGINTGGLSFIPAPTDTRGRGWIGGGEVGCNWQMDRWVVFGVEADIDAIRAPGSAATFGPTDSSYQSGPGPLFVNFATGTANEQVSLRWLSTIRARVGLTVLADRGMLFLTGGLAVGGVSSSGIVNIAPVASAPFPASVMWGGSNSSTQAGYTVGGGFEYALTDRWTTKAEYLFYDLGKVSHPVNLIASAGNPASEYYSTLGNTVSSVRGSMIRAGLNYRFNWGRPVVAGY